MCSVQLARRVLQLERANTNLKKEIERETTKSLQLAGEVSATSDFHGLIFLTISAKIIGSHFA